MTDNEIIRAKAHFEYGIKCDIFQEPVLSYAKTVLEAFDEINRLKAENEHYSHNINVMTTDIRNLQKANDRLKTERDKEHAFCNHYMRMCAKAETINHKHHKEKHCFLNHTILHIIVHLAFHLVLHGVLEHIIH